MRLAAVSLTALLLATPAQALTVTWTDTGGGSLWYTPVSNGPMYAEWYVEFGPAPEGTAHDPRYGDASVSVFLAGDFMVRHYETAGFPTQYVFCLDNAVNCVIQGGWYRNYADYPLMDVYWLINSGSTYRPFIRSSITFTGPDAAVPIPAALPLLGTALAGLGFLAWRRR